MMQTIGTCSICGGDVQAHTGAWHGTIPPPPPTCVKCGAVARESAPNIIPMVPSPQSIPWFRHVDGNADGGGGVWREFPNSNTGTP